VFHQEFNMPFISRSFASQPQRDTDELELELILDLIQSDFEPTTESDSISDSNASDEIDLDFLEAMAVFEILGEQEEDGLISIDKHYLQLFMILFTPVMLALLFAFELKNLWKQSKRNRSTQL
jgi:hypothetical protein